MNHERNLDVTEARVGLTLVICLLLVLGYMLLHYLGGTRQAPDVEIRPGIAADPTSPSKVAISEAEQQPQVLTVESGDVSEHARRTAPEVELRY